MRSWPGRRTRWISLAILAAVVPATALAITLLPAAEAPPEGPEPAAPTVSSASSSRPATTSRPKPRATTTPPPSAPPEVRSTEQAAVAGPAAPAGGSDGGPGGDWRADHVDSIAMVPQPRPPATPYIAPGVEADISEADNDPGIDLGTLAPEPEAPYTPSAVQGP